MDGLMTYCHDARKGRYIEVVQMRAVPLVSGCVELEMNLVEPADKIDGQAGTIFLFG